MANTTPKTITTHAMQNIITNVRNNTNYPFKKTDTEKKESTVLPKVGVKSNNDGFEQYRENGVSYPYMVKSSEISPTSDMAVEKRNEAMNTDEWKRIDAITKEREEKRLLAMESAKLKREQDDYNKKLAIRERDMYNPKTKAGSEARYLASIISKDFYNARKIKDYTLEDIYNDSLDFSATIQSDNYEYFHNEISLAKAKNLRDAMISYKNKNGSLPAEYEQYLNAVNGFISTLQSDGSVIREFSASDKQKNNKLESSSLSNYGIVLDATPGTLTQAQYNVYTKPLYTTPLKDLSGSQIFTLFNSYRHRMDELKKTNPDVYNYLLLAYQDYTSSSEMLPSDKFDAATNYFWYSGGKALEGVGRGAVNFFASGADLLITDDEISKEIDDFIKGNYVRYDEPDRLKYLNENTKKYSGLVGQSMQLLPAVIMNLFVPGSGLAVIGTQVFGNSYSQARRDGASKNRAAAYGLASAGTEMAIEYLCSSFAVKGSPVSSQIINKVASSVKSNSGQQLVRLLLEGGGEGFEEVLSYFAEPLIKKIYDSESDFSYSLEEAAYNFAGGFIGSAIFGGGADLVGMRKSPATEISIEAENAVKKLQTELVKNGFTDMKKVSKLLSEAESLVKQASWFENETQKFVLPENLATIFEAAKTVKYNPNTIEALKLQEEYKGVTPGKVDYEVKDYVVADDNKKSIVTLPDGKKFVKASRQVISGDNPEIWASDVMKYINNEIRQGKDVSFTGMDGEVLTITRDTAGKARFRNAVHEKGGVRRALSDDEYALKLRVESHIDEIAQVSKGNNDPLTPDRKNHPFAKDGFKYRTAFFEDFDGQYYYIRFSVGHTGEVKTVYNVGQIKNRNGTPSFGSKAARQDAAKVTHSYEESITQQNPIVNAKSAISHKTSVVLNALAKFTGVNIGFANDITDSDGRAVDGIYDSATKQITLSLNAQKPLLFTAIHESMHHIRSYNPKLYALLSANILSVYKNNPDAFNVLFGEKASRYAKDIESLSLDDAVDYLSEELMSDLMAEVMCSPKGLNSLARLDRNTAQRIFDSAIDTFDFMIGRYEKLNVEHDAQMQKAIDLILAEKKSFIDMYTRGVEEYAEFGENGKVRNAPILYNRTVPFNKQVDDVLKPNSDYKQYVYVGHAFNLLNKCGFDDIPVLMTPGHIRDINTPKSENKPNESRFHGLTPEQIKHIPNILKNPVMIYDSISPDNKDNTVCVLSNEFDDDELPIIVVFKYVEGIPDTRVPSHCIVETQNYNMVASEYGKDGFYNHLREVIDKDAVLYVSKSKMEKFLKKETLNLSTSNKVQFLESFEKLGFDNIIHQSRNLVKKNSTSKISLSRQTVEDSSSLSDVQLNIISDITRRAGERYGIRQLSMEEMKDVSLKQSDIDMRLGRNFRFDDTNMPTNYRDINHNSLHLSDSVVFSSGKGANANYGTGRILDFGKGDEVIIAVDSGPYSHQITVPSAQVTFIAHNNEQTVSADYVSGNNTYERAKTTFDNFGKSGEIRALDTFGFNEAQHYLFDSSEKLYTIGRFIALHNDGTDFGAGTHSSKNSVSDSGNFDSFEYSAMSYRDLLLQYYDAVRNTNLARDISELYIALGKETIDIERMVENLKDVDSLNPFRKGNSITNGSYYMNDVYRNFERVFGNYFDVVKPYLDNLDRSKGDYARNLLDKAEYLSRLCSKYNFKPGDDFDKAVQMYGEGSVHINLINPKDKKLYNRLGLDSSNFGYSKEFDVAIDDVSLIKLVGEDRVNDVKECAKEFRQLYDEYLVRVNETIARIYPGQTDRLIKPKEKYFRHFKEVTDSLTSLMYRLVEKAEIDPELSGISNRTKPKKSFESYMQERKGDETDYSAIGGFIDYIQQAEYTICINPHIKVFRELRQNLAGHKSAQGSDSLNGFLSYLDTFANHLAKKTTGFDRILTDYLGSSGRGLLKAIGVLNNQVMQNNIVGNASVALKQVLNLPNGLVYLQKPSLLVKSTLGLFKALTTDEKLQAEYDSLMQKSNYLQERFVEKYLYKKKSAMRKVSENITSIGDEFAVRAIWLAAYEDGVRLDVPNPVVYADDIARKCSAGRGIGEKPIAFTQQVTKLFLPYLLEGNNNWNVWRDLFKNTVSDKNKTGHEFDDKNSYLYYNNQKTKAESVCSRSYRLALLLIVANGVGELFEKLLGTRPLFDPIDDFKKAFKRSNQEGKDFNFKSFVNALINGGVNTFNDFAEHRNFSWVYSMISSYLSDDPLKSNDSIMTSVPLGSALANIVKTLVAGDYIGAGLEIGTNFLLPYGGGQVKKSVKGIADVALGGKYKNSATKILGGSPRGGLRYDIAQTPANYIRGALFGTSSLPESRAYWDEKDAEKTINIFKEKENSFEKFQSSFRKQKDEYHKALSRLQDETGNNNALPYAYIEESYVYESLNGETVTFELEPEERQKLQEDINKKLDSKFKDVCSSVSFKTTDDKGKMALLNNERKKIVSAFENDIINAHKYDGFIKDYRAAHGDDAVMKVFDATKDYSILPTSEVGRIKNYTLNGQDYSFELTDDDIKKYSEIMNAEIEKEYALTVDKNGWTYKSNTTKKELLAEAKKSAKERVSEFIKWDHVYGDNMKQFDDANGADNPVRQAYEYSHDATVYPYWALSETIEFTKDKKKWTYTISREPNSHGKEVEYDFLSNYINSRYYDNYVNNAIAGGYLEGKSPEEIYHTLIDYKSSIRTVLNRDLKEYVIARAKLYPNQIEIE